MVSPAPEGGIIFRFNITCACGTVGLAILALQSGQEVNTAEIGSADYTCQSCGVVAHLRLVVEVSFREFPPFSLN